MATDKNSEAPPAADPMRPHAPSEDAATGEAVPSPGTPESRVLGLGRSAWTVLILVAVVVVTATALGVFYASRSVEVTDPGQVKVPDALARTQPKAPGSFASETEGRQFFVKMLQAARRGNEQDLEFLASLFGDRREIPIPPRPEPEKKKPEGPDSEDAGIAKALQGLSIPDPRKTSPGYDTVQNVAIGFLVGIGPQSTPVALATLKKVHAEHDAQKPWSFDEVQVLRCGFSTLGQIQARLMYLLKGHPSQKDAEFRTPLALFASTEGESVWGLGDQQINLEQQVREIPLGIVQLADAELKMQATKLGGEKFARYDVTPERFSSLMSVLEADLWPMVRTLTEAMKKANEAQGVPETQEKETPKARDATKEEAEK